METITRKPASIRLRADLLDTLKAKAIASNRSFNNLVESILLNAVSIEKRKYDYPISDNIPNEETAQAIRESQEGIGLSKVETSSFENFCKSLED